MTLAEFVELTPSFDWTAHSSVERTRLAALLGRFTISFRVEKRRSRASQLPIKRAILAPSALDSCPEEDECGQS